MSGARSHGGMGSAIESAYESEPKADFTPTVASASSHESASASESVTDADFTPPSIPAPASPTKTESESVPWNLVIPNL